MRYFTSYFTILLLVHSSISFANTDLVIKNGLLDLRGETITEKYLIKLNGEWEFYWKKMLRPYNFDETFAPAPDAIARVPSYWTDLNYYGKKLEGQGYATYRLVILLPSGPKPNLGLDVKVMDSAYDLYVNGKFLGSNGIPGTQVENTVPKYDPTIYRFIPTSDTVEIIFNVSNFHHRRGGFWLPVGFGSFAKIQQVAANNFGRSIATVGILLTFSLFFLFFFVIYPRDKVSLYFSIALFGIGMRDLFTNQMLIDLFLSPGWTMTVRFEYISTYIAVTGALWFLYSLYKKPYQKVIALTFTTVFSILSISTFILKVSTFSYFTYVTYLAIIIFAIDSLITSVIQLFRKRSFKNTVYLVGFLLIVASATHDSVLAAISTTGATNYITQEVLIIFMLMQAGMLTYNWVSSFLEKEKLREELETLNRNLETMVTKRTVELINAKNQAEALNLQLGKKNQNLSETIQLKNKVFSVIAHDLRSPVVNILYILNLLKEEEYRDKYESLAGSCIQYSQMVINLLENMLVWGRGQEDRIRYSPEYHDLANIILTNMSIYKDTADRKNISVNFTQIGGTRAWFDKDLIDIVIRNLLSNAIKFTNRGGRISILVKEKPKKEGSVLIKICDNGIGIPKEVIPGLTGSGEIISTPGTENEKGTGLGLRLSYDLVAVNKGTIEIETKQNDGTCFSITLPASKDHVD